MVKDPIILAEVPGGIGPGVGFGLAVGLGVVFGVALGKVNWVWFMIGLGRKGG